jgi:hypothetical protein
MPDKEHAWPHSQRRAGMKLELEMAIIKHLNLEDRIANRQAILPK